MACAEAPPSHLHWLRLSGDRVSSQKPRTRLLQLQGNARPWGGEAAQVGKEQSPTPGKPCLEDMGGEVRLPPGEPCREGECMPQPGVLASG